MPREGVCGLFLLLREQEAYMLQLTNDQVKFIEEIAGILKAIGGNIPQDIGGRETTFEYQFFTLLRTARERFEETGGFVPKVTSYPDGSRAEFIIGDDGIGIKFTMPNSNYTMLHIGEDGVTVNDVPVVLDE
jgi:hypothetical protein